MASRHIRINFSSDLTRKVLDIFNTVQTQIRKRNRIKNNELITDVQVRPIEKPAKFYYSIEYDSNDENVFRIIFSQKREGNYKFLASTKPESGMGSSIPFPEKQKYESGFDDINTYNEKTRMLLTHGNIYDLSFVEYKDNLLYKNKWIKCIRLRSTLGTQARDIIRNTKKRKRRKGMKKPK